MRHLASAFVVDVRLIVKTLAVGALVLSGACSAAQAPAQWTLWYIPNEPKPGDRIAAPCRTYVFATAPSPVEYSVAVIKGWTGASRPQGNTAIMHSGENFSGVLELGQETIHDDSNGYELSVLVVYKIGTYLAAKARADADCPLAVNRVRS